MRLAALLVLAACGSKAVPPPPDRAVFDQLSLDGKCQATLPVGARCANEVVDAELASLIPDAKAPGDRVSGKEAENIYLEDCHGDSEGRVAAAAYGCWSKADDCEAFAKCVVAAEPPLR